MAPLTPSSLTRADAAVIKEALNSGVYREYDGVVIGRRVDGVLSEEFGDLVESAMKLTYDIRYERASPARPDRRDVAPTHRPGALVADSVVTRDVLVLAAPLFSPVRMVEVDLAPSDSDPRRRYESIITVESLAIKACGSVGGG